MPWQRCDPDLGNEVYLYLIVKVCRSVAAEDFAFLIKVGLTYTSPFLLALNANMVPRTILDQ